MEMVKREVAVILNDPSYWEGNAQFTMVPVWFHKFLSINAWFKNLRGGGETEKIKILEAPFLRNS